MIEYRKKNRTWTRTVLPGIILEGYFVKEHRKTKPLSVAYLSACRTSVSRCFRKLIENMVEIVMPSFFTMPGCEAICLIKVFLKVINVDLNNVVVAGAEDLL